MGFDTYIRFALALVLVVGLIAFIAWLVRRFGILGKLSPGAGTPSGRKRLSVIEACGVDARRRLVLVRCDNTEHLILLTGNGSGVVVERGIGTSGSSGGNGSGGRRGARKKQGFRDMAEDAASRDDWDDWTEDDESAAQAEAEAPAPRTPVKGRD